ncbi:alpha-ketoglutarate-dependent dioxygenase alkB homolog 3-like [Phoenix dactylifera]|uniref:Alpha-ketoglutarate-dependent dioxygenase alkB homolog 3-like n=1 Tax=Phoenix dactylifera TaxID=42345 RepID=A0A8B9AKJ9_PHODC|nr:alpha-ketoglutarate-dependent dioxygenase alkB homolog 3-like [Phoenix dactylifera]
MKSPNKVLYLGEQQNMLEGDNVDEQVYEPNLDDVQDSDNDCAYEDHHVGCIRSTLGVIRCALTQPKETDDLHRSTIFHTYIKCGTKDCKVIIDSGSCINAVSISIVSRLGLKPTPHPNPYKVSWVDTSSIAINERCLVPIQFLSYEDDVWCDIVPMDMGHIILGCPSLFERDVTIFGPRDTCYVASEGFTELKYSGYQPHAYSWDDYPVLKDILKAVHEALPGSKFNSLLLNRYKSGSDYVAWHSDDEKLYGPTPEIASVSFGCEREFLLRKKPAKTPQAARGAEKSAGKRPKGSPSDQHGFVLRHGSLLVMRGYTQRDWVHSIPKRVKANSVRINLTFRLVPT